MKMCLKCHTVIGEQAVMLWVHPFHPDCASVLNAPPPSGKALRDARSDTGVETWRQVRIRSRFWLGVPGLPTPMKVSAGQAVLC